MVRVPFLYADPAMGNRSSVLTPAALVLLLSSCRGGDDRSSRVEPTKIEPEQGTAVERSLVCLESWNDGKFDELAGCFSEPFSYRDNLGGSGSRVSEQIERAKVARGSRTFPERKPIAVIGDDQQVFMLWVESGTYAGTLEDQEIDSMPYAVLGAHFWTGLDRDGAFHAVAEYRDPNMLLNQVGKAPRTSHGPVTAPDSPIVLQRDDAAAKEALAVVRRRVKATNEHDLEALALTYAPDVVGVVSSNVNDAHQRAGVLAGVPRGWAAYPDVKVKVDQIWGAGDFVVLEGTFTGTNTGDLGSGVEATKKSFEQPFVELLEVSNGEIKRFWRVVDSLAVARQVGLLE